MSQTATVSQEAPSIELGRLRGNHHAHFDPKTTTATEDNGHGVDVGDSAATETADSGDPPPHAQKEVERWNRPRGNMGRLGFAFLSFIIAGMNDAAVGVWLLVSPTVVKAATANHDIELTTLGRL